MQHDVIFSILYDEIHFQKKNRHISKSRSELTFASSPTLGLNTVAVGCFSKFGTVKAKNAKILNIEKRQKIIISKGMGQF